MGALKRFLGAVLLQPIGLAVALVLLVVGGWEAALIAVAITILVTILLVALAIRKGWKGGKKFVNDLNTNPVFISDRRPPRTVDGDVVPEDVAPQRPWYQQS